MKKSMTLKWIWVYGNANLAGYTDSLSNGVHFIDAWVDAESVDPFETYKQPPYNNGYDLPPEEANLQNPAMFSSDLDSILNYIAEASL